MFTAIMSAIMVAAAFGGIDANQDNDRLLGACYAAIFVAGLYFVAAINL